MSTAPANESNTPAGQPDWSGAQKLAAGAAVGGLALYGIVGAINLTGEHGNEHGMTDLLTAWMSGWVYWFSMPLGGLALLMIHYLAKSSWGLLLKRSFEASTRTLPLMALLFVPVALGLTLGERSPYWWVEPEKAKPMEIAPPAKAPEGDKQLEAHESKLTERRKAAEQMVHKAVEDAREAARKEREEHAEGNYGFLSKPSFVVLAVVLFVVWGAMSFFLNKWGQEAQDDPARVEDTWRKATNLSGPGLIIYAITVTAAATQWVMSLQEGWASTMFPVVFAINQFLTCLAFSVAVFLLLSARPPFFGVVRPKFQLDMGSLMLAFTLFWSYTSFSQLMLIWIGNLPEEIPFFLKRSDGAWWWVSAGLILFHFACPFVLLLFRDIKLHPVRLRVMAVYLLVVCAVDVVWWVEPTKMHHDALFVLMDAGAVVGIGGVWGLGYLYFLKRRPLLPTNELYMLPEGHHHEHH